MWFGKVAILLFFPFVNSCQFMPSSGKLVRLVTRFLFVMVTGRPERLEVGLNLWERSDSTGFRKEGGGGLVRSADMRVELAELLKG